MHACSLPSEDAVIIENEAMLHKDSTCNCQPGSLKFNSGTL